MILLVLAVIIYISCTADSTKSCAPNDECETCPFPCDKRKI